MYKNVHSLTINISIEWIFTLCSNHTDIQTKIATIIARSVCFRSRDATFCARMAYTHGVRCLYWYPKPIDQQQPINSATAHSAEQTRHTLTHAQDTHSEHKSQRNLCALHICVQTLLGSSHARKDLSIYITYIYTQTKLHTQHTLCCLRKFVDSTSLRAKARQNSHFQ